MAEQPSIFARQLSETKKRVLADRDKTIVETRTRRLDDLRKVNPDEVAKLIIDCNGKIEEAVKKGNGEVLILTFLDKEVICPPDQTTWCMPHPDWLKGNHREVFRHYDKGGLKPVIREWMDQKNMVQGYAIWVQIP